MEEDSDAETGSSAADDEGYREEEPSSVYRLPPTAAGRSPALSSMPESAAAGSRHGASSRMATGRRVEGSWVGATLAQREQGRALETELASCESALREVEENARIAHMQQGPWSDVLVKAQVREQGLVLGPRLQTLAANALDAGCSRTVPGALDVCEHANGLLERLAELVRTAGQAALPTAGGSLAHAAGGTLGVQLPQSPSATRAPPADAALDRAIKDMDLTLPDGDSATYVSHRLLEPSRQRIVATAFPECGEDGGRVVAIVVNGEFDETRELAALVHGGPPYEPELLTCSCQITFEDLAPADCIEYVFDEAPGQWAMSQLSRDALESYRGMKFDAWKNMLLEPTCEAQFRRMLQIGLVTRLYDPHVFPTPTVLKERYQVVDHRSGRLIQLPHPVSELRVWNPESGAYEQIDPRLTGAPPAAEEEAWWAAFIDDLNKQHGEEYIARLRQDLG